MIVGMLQKLQSFYQYFIMIELRVSKISPNTLGDPGIPWKRNKKRKNSKYLICNDVKFGHERSLNDKKTFCPVSTRRRQLLYRKQSNNNHVPSTNSKYSRRSQPLQTN